VTGSGNFEELSKFSRLARVAFEDTSRAISGQALILSGDKWVDFVPSDPALADFISLRRERQNISYDNQTPLLQKLYDNRGEDVYVADFDLFRPDERSPWLSFTTWASGHVGQSDADYRPSHGGDE
jgi:hypothetical protein